MTIYACCDHCSMRGPHEAHATPCSALCSEGGERAQGLREGAASETGAQRDRFPPEGLNGLTGAAYTDVIRRAAETRSSALTEALARIESLWNVIRANGDTNARLSRERDEALARLTDSEARVERLWAQLNEATNVPDAPAECCASGRCEVCCPGYVWGRDG